MGYIKYLVDMNYILQTMAQWTCKDNILRLLDVTWKNWGDHIKVSENGYMRKQSKLHTLNNKVYKQFMSKDMFQHNLKRCPYTPSDFIGHSERDLVGK
jgi:hypothetical protein